jgi:hypothetical protein
MYNFYNKIAEERDSQYSEATDLFEDFYAAHEEFYGEDIEEAYSDFVEIIEDEYAKPGAIRKAIKQAAAEGKSPEEAMNSLPQSYKDQVINQVAHANKKAAQTQPARIVKDAEVKTKAAEKEILKATINHESKRHSASNAVTKFQKKVDEKASLPAKAVKGHSEIDVAGKHALNKQVNQVAAFRKLEEVKDAKRAEIASHNKAKDAVPAKSGKQRKSKKAPQDMASKVVAHPESVHGVQARHSAATNQGEELKSAEAKRRADEAAAWSAKNREKGEKKAAAKKVFFSKARMGTMGKHAAVGAGAGAGVGLLVNGIRNRRKGEKFLKGGGKAALIGGGAGAAVGAGVGAYRHKD